MTPLDPVFLRRAMRPTLSVVASLAIHLALVGGAVAIGVKAMATPVAPVIMAQLMAAEPPAPPPVEPPKARPAPPKPLALPKPISEPKIETPPPAAVKEPEPPPVAVAPAPEPRPAEPAAPSSPSPEPRRVASGPPAGAPLPSGVSVVSSEPSRATPAATAGRPGGANVAALVPDVTQLAVPRGGYQVKPSYPPAARRSGIQGTTILRVFVAADGRVGDVTVETSAGHPDLDRAAADAVRRWRFEPGRRGTEAIAMWVRLPVEFRLR